MEGELVLKFVETDDLIVAKEADERGAYKAQFKTSSIARRPENEYEREKFFRKAIDDVRLSIEKIRASFD